ncbi:S49 family peptidase [Paracoccus sanguinis]|uniref:S49 family peptidase n=1 Tax=Paracoccus sanguinis TaxID=1545044 RepID=UPI000695B1AC|nr:S49 family peptidase [Paracoccus sanguinis]
MKLSFHLAERVLNRPLLIHPDKALIIADALAGRIGLADGAVLDAMTPDASRFYGTRVSGDGGVALTPRTDGVAIITIAGSLVNRGAWVGANSGLVSYEGIAAQVAEAQADRSITSVILDIDSGGGEAGGITSLGQAIAALAATKRTVAVVNDTACSAAYWIASQANEIVVSETSAVGSIGVVSLHVDRSGEMAEMGWVPTLIHAGAHKVDGHPFGALPDDVRASWQASIDGLYATFCDAVGRGRGARLDAAGARATEARVLYGREAIAAGLADRLGTFAEVLADLKPRAPRGAAKPAPAAAQTPGAPRSERAAPAVSKPAPPRRQFSVRYDPGPSAQEIAERQAREKASEQAAMRARVVAEVNRRRGFC